MSSEESHTKIPPVHPIGTNAPSPADQSPQDSRPSPVSPWQGNATSSPSARPSPVYAQELITVPRVDARPVARVFADGRHYERTETMLLDTDHNASHAEMPYIGADVQV